MFEYHETVSGVQFHPSGESIDDNKDILITICILGEWSDMIQMKNFKWVT
jgi:hypothetical protein